MSKPLYEPPEGAFATEDSEKYRPVYHYTADRDWLSDPNGMVYHDGEFHLCYQHDDYHNVFGGMSWGHAVSKDLLDWRELPKAIEPDEQLGMCFSGCLLVDKNNTAGFGYNALVGFYTSELPKQQQSLVYSTDRGRSFKKYDKNPVIKNVGDMSPDFRDPKVMWYEPRALWLMALAGPERIEFWTSPNLINWQFESCFGEGLGTHAGEWECPDLRRMPIDGDDDNQAWVLIVSVNPGGPNGGSGTQYFIGGFAEIDGKLSFYSEQQSVRWLDWGIDNYASVGWTNLEDSMYAGRVLSIGWMNNWNYAYFTPTNQWRGVMTMIRELKLETFAENTLLTCRPAHFYDRLLGHEISGDDMIEMGKVIKVGEGLSASRLRIAIDVSQVNDVGVELGNHFGEVTRVGYNKSAGLFYIDRSESGNRGFAAGFAGKHTAIVDRTHDLLEIEVYIDRCSIEAFFNNGECAMSELIYPIRPLSTVIAYADGPASICSFSIQKLNTIKKINE